MAVKRTPAGLRTTLFAFAEPGPRVDDGDAGYRTSELPLEPAELWGSIAPAAPKDLEKLAAGTTLAVGSFLIVVPYHAGVTTKTILRWQDRAGNGHVAHVTGYSNPDQLGIETVIVAAERVL